MSTLTPSDSFALAQIARSPTKYKKLVRDLSDAAKPIGRALVAGGPAQGGRDVVITVRFLRKWAKRRR